MKFAVSSPNVGSPADLIQLAIAAEQSGWDGFFLWDHLHLQRQLRLDVFDPWVVLGAVAQATERLILGTMVTPLPRRRPWTLAKQIITLDHLAGGRTVIGIGLGHPGDQEFSAFGESGDVHVRAALLDEGLLVLDGLLHGGPFQHSGAAFDLDVDLRPGSLQQPRPPIWIAGGWPNAGPIERARRFDGYFPVAVDGEPLTPAHIADVVARVQPSDGFEIVSPWAEGHAADEYRDAGATWLVESRWPVDDWFSDLLDATRRGPG